jgi:hypothetical protein
MTAPDPVAAFVQALPPRLRRDLNRTAALVSDIHQATRRGWTTQQLIDATTNNHGGATNHGGIIAHRLATRCALVDPSTGEGITELDRRVPFCSDECRADAGWILNDLGLPVDKCSCRTPNQEAAIS